MTKAQTPFLVVNPKSYLYGEKSLELAKAADKVAKETGIQIYFTCPFADIRYIKENTENIIDVVTVDEKKNKTKKNIIKVVSIFSASAIGLCALGGVVLYNIVKSNINYTEQQAKEIALSQVPGQVVYVTKDIDLDHLGLEYDIKIKDKNNIIREVTVDSKYGAISDFENYYYND